VALSVRKPPEIVLRVSLLFSKITSQIFWDGLCGTIADWHYLYLGFQSFNDGDHDLIAGGGVQTMRRSVVLAIPKSRKPDSNNEGGLKEKVIDTNQGDRTMTITYWAENMDKAKDKPDEKKDESEIKGRGLQARLYQFDPDDPDSKDGYKQLELIKSETEADNGPKDNGSEKSSLTAYNAVVPLKKEAHHRQFARPNQPRSSTFLVAIRLFEGPKTGPRRWPKLPSSEELYDHIAVHPKHENATGAMWERVFLDRRKYGKGPEPVLDLAEFNMIGRSLEKILQVDIVPATFFDDDEGPKRKKYSALVSNLFIKQNVDLKALL
jgi:hypothetical protein